MKLANYSLLKEDENQYQLKGPKGESFNVEKAKLSEKAHGLIRNLKTAEFNTGGATGSWDADPAAVPAPEQAAVPQAAPATPAVAAPTVAAPQPSAPAEMTPEMTMIGGKPTSSLADLEKQKATITSAQNVQQAAANQEAAAYKQAAADMQQTQANFEKKKADLQAKDTTLQEELRSKTIDPHRLVNNMSTLSRIGMIFASALAGAGAGLAKSDRNPVLENLNRAIDADIEAQKNDQSKSMNLWKMNKEALGDLEQANLATQNQLLTVAKTKAMEAASHVNAADAQLKILPLVQQIDAQKAAIQHKMALFSQMKAPTTGGGLSDTDPSLLVEDMVPENLRKDVYEEIKIAKDTKTAKAEIDAAFEDLVKHRHDPRLALPGVENPYVGRFHQALQPTLFHKDDSASVANQLSTHRSLTPGLLSTDEDVDVFRKAKDAYLASKMAAPISKGQRLDLEKFRSTNMTAPSYAPGTIIEKGGVKYSVGADGRTATKVK